MSEPSGVDLGPGSIKLEGVVLPHAETGKTVFQGGTSVGGKPGVPLTFKAGTSSVLVTDGEVELVGPITFEDGARLKIVRRTK